MDEIDQTLLSALAANARTSVSDLARQLGLARTTIQARIERLERQGHIAGYTLRPGPASAQGRIRATALLQVEPRATPQVLSRLGAMPAVTRVHTSSGRFDMIVEITAPDTANLDAQLDQIGSITGIVRSESLIQLTTKIDRPF